MRIDPQSAASAPTNPYHIARAYGVRPPIQPAAIAPTAPARSVETPPESERPAGVRKLVAGVVPGGVSFESSGEAQPARAALPMYRHPADKNAAATAVSVGRSLDIRG